MKRHGIRIAEVNEQEQLLVLETRRELERLIATRAARRASAEDKKTLAAMAQALLKAGKAGDVVEMLRQYFVAKTFTAAARATASPPRRSRRSTPCRGASTSCITRS
jgi:DNA-binding GntR family transcriptional regulator